MIWDWMKRVLIEGDENKEEKEIKAASKSSTIHKENFDNSKMV